MKQIVIMAFGLVLSLKAVAKVDLRISDDETYKRPNSWSMKVRNQQTRNSEFLFGEATNPSSRAGISIAWRNANQIEEVEVRVQNVGSEPGEGKIFVEIVDDAGNILLRLEPPDELKVVRLPALERGGREGKIIRMKASWELNALIDRFDLTRTRYGVKATIETVGEDANWLDNSKIKEWNIPFRLQPGQLSVYNYTFKNTSSDRRELKWLFEHTDLPSGCKMRNVPRTGKRIYLEPNEEVKGVIMLTAAEVLTEGTFIESRLSLVDVKTNHIFQQHEWFQVYDTEKPTVSNYRIVLLEDHTMAIQALVADKGSGVLEATGVSTEFSVDNGKTWAKKSHNYKVGNFIRPTLFETVLGPFAPETNVLLRFTAMDTYGNAQTIIPNDASAFVAPRNAQLLLQQSYIFPRTNQNMIFDLEKIKNLGLTLEKLKSMNVDLDSVDISKENILGVDPARLKSLNFDIQRLNDIKDDLKKLSKLDLDVTSIRPVEIERVKALGEGILDISTLKFVVK